MVSALLIAGPTAVGKSAVAMELALRLGGEILSADSMQVYRGLDIGTAKPTHERDRVPHHLIDLVDPDQGFDAQRWLLAARSAAEDVVARGRLPIVCGGTGLYFRAWIEGLDPLPAADPELRRELESRSLPELLAELASEDPAAWARIDRQNPRRVVRAVEILRNGGRPRRAAGGSVAASDAPGDPIFVLRRAPDDLRRRMDTRVEAMLEAGLLEETRALLARGLDRNPVALQAIGYRQIVQHLRGELDWSTTVATIKTKTWQFGRRQMTWFRHRPGVVWIEVGLDESAEQTALRVLGHPAVLGA